MLYGVGSLHHEAFSAHTGPLLPRDDLVVLSQKLVLAEACIATQAEKMHSYDAYFQYLVEKDPDFVAKFKEGNQTTTAAENATRTEDPETATGETGTGATGTGATGTSATRTGTAAGSSPSAAI